MLAFFGGVLLVVLRAVLSACKEVEQFTRDGSLPAADPVSPVKES